MILAELHGKIPSKMEHKEDMLTSNVFSFFKYSNRRYFYDYLKELGLSVSQNEAENAEFMFWPSYEDGTEPDLVIICGDYYLLFEAKLYSGFSEKLIDEERHELEHQLEREARMGSLEALMLHKKFILIAITSEYFKRQEKYSRFDNLGFVFIWTNWQHIAYFLYTKISDSNKNQDKEFLSDLYKLLINKKLRSFVSFRNLKPEACMNTTKIIFYNAKTSVFKGEYSGFNEILLNTNPISQYTGFYKRLFLKLNPVNIQKPQNNIFYNGKK